jgi:predicted amidohydrolase YtcJ
MKWGMTMSAGSNAEQIDLVYTGGEVLASGAGPVAEAIHIRDGRIAAIGTADDVIAQAGPGAERQSLDGATIIPGLIDTHPHLLHFSAFKASTVDILDAKNHDDIVEAIRKEAALTPPGEWIMTSPVGEPYYFHRRSYRDLAEGTLPGRHVLDRATAEHPVIILSWAPVTPNICAMNSAALTALGIDSSTPDRVSNVWIEKDADGTPSGVLRGSVNDLYNPDPFFNDLINRTAPLIKPDKVFDGLLAGMARYNSMGFTTIYEAHAMDLLHIEAYKALRAQELLTLRVQTLPELQNKALPDDPYKSTAEQRATLELALGMRNLDDDWLRIDGITATPTGPCYCGYAVSKAGYKDPFGNITHGQRVLSEDDTRLAFDYCAEHGLRLNVLAITTDDLDEVIDLTTEAMAKHNLDRVNWIVQHAELTREDQSRRLAQLGLDVTISMSFTFGKGDMMVERFGPEVLEWLNPLRNHLDAGLNVAASMDWGPTNPWEQMQLAVTHQMFPSGRRNAGQAQVITRAEAFDMWSSAGAKLLGWDGIGRLAVGHHADLAIVDRNPVTCDIDALPSTEVLRTMVGGRIVHDNGSIAAPATVAT